MTKRIIILGLIVCSLLAVSINSVVAEDEEFSFDDSERDVADLEQGTVYPEIPDIPEIDILKITYTKTGNAVSIEIDLRDNLELSESIYSILELQTSERTYEIAFVGNTLFSATTDLEEEITAELSGFGTKTLTMTFDLIDENEEYTDMIFTLMKNEDSVAYVDMAPEPEIGNLTVDVKGPYQGKTNKSITFACTVEGGTPPYQWVIDFGDDSEPVTYESSDTSWNPTHVYDTEGTYEVYLYVTDSTEENYGDDNTTAVITASSGTSGGSSSGSGLTMFIVLIAIIVIAGVAVLVYVIKR